MVKVIEQKNIQSKVSKLSDGDIVLSICKKKNYKLYLREISKLKF